MTEQYPNPNVNLTITRGERVVTATGSANLDDDLVTFDSTAGAITFTLASASQTAGRIVYLKANNAGTTGNTVTIASGVGQNIDGLASVILAQDQDALTVKSDGTNWRVMGAGGTASSGGLIPTGTIFTSAVTANVDDRVRYDPSGGTFTISAPAGPTLAERFAVKNMTTDLTAITVSGNGNNIEDVTAGTFGATTSLTGAAVAITFQFDGTQWLIV